MTHHLHLLLSPDFSFGNENTVTTIYSIICVLTCCFNFEFYSAYTKQVVECLQLFVGESPGRFVPVLPLPLVS